MSVPYDAPLLVPTPIAFVGEAPSHEEVEKGRPLVGPSGKIFDALLRTANLERSHFLVTNVFDEKAPGNDVTGWMKDPERYSAAKLRLSGELARYAPHVIVPLGGTALHALLGTDQIMSHRGAVIAATDVAPGAKMVPTLHPAFVMHTWKMFSIVAGDLIKAAREAAKGPKIVYPFRRLVVAPSIKEVEAYVEDLFKADLVSVDIETRYGQITCIGLGGGPESCICIPFVDATQTNYSYWQDAAHEVRAWLAIKRLLEDPTVAKLGQNFAGYDWLWLLKKAGIGVRGLREDTRLLHHALFPELPKSLAFMGSAYTNQGVWKTWGHGGKEKKDD